LARLHRLWRRDYSPGHDISVSTAVMAVAIAPVIVVPVTVLVFESVKGARDVVIDR
jgi:hypothetical protein